MVHIDAEQLKIILSTAKKLAGNKIHVLAEALKVSVPTIYAWLNGTRSPNRTSIDAIHQYINAHSVYPNIIGKKPPPTIFSDPIPKTPDPDIPPTTEQEQYYFVPFLNTHLQGTGDKYAFRVEWLKRITNNNEKRVFMYRNIGLQMKPLFSSEAMLLINPCEPTLKHKKIYLIVFNKNVYVRRFFDSSQKYIFKVENEEFELQNFIFHEKKDFDILGQVIWFCNEL